MRGWEENFCSGDSQSVLAQRSWGQLGCVCVGGGEKALSGEVNRHGMSQKDSEQLPLRQQQGNQLEGTRLGKKTAFRSGCSSYRLNWQSFEPPEKQQPCPSPAHTVTGNPTLRLNQPLPPHQSKCGQASSAFKANFKVAKTIRSRNLKL